MKGEASYTDASQVDFFLSVAKKSQIAILLHVFVRIQHIKCR